MTLCWPRANAAPANASFARGLGRVPLSLHCRLRGRTSGAARGVRTTAPEAGSGPAGVAGAGPGAAGRRGELRPSDLPTFPPDGRLPPAGRVHAYLLCSGAARLPCRPGGRTDGAGGRPSARPAQPAQQRPGPSGHVTQFPGQPHTRGPGFRHPFAAATTPRSSPLLHSPCRPGARSLPARRQPGHRPLHAGAASTPGIPTCSSCAGSPTAQHASQSRYHTGSSALGLAGGGGREAGGARAGRSRTARSPRRGASGRAGACPARPGPAPQAPPAGRRAIERPLWQA